TAAWPELPFSPWRDTAMTLQLWTQVVGKVRLALTPWINHSWQVPLYVTARGLGTSPIPPGDQSLGIEFDFVAQRLLARTSTGAEKSFALEPQTVAAFNGRVQTLMRDLGVAVTINDMPNELPDAIPFSTDETHKSYDALAAHRFWRALVPV